MTSVTLKFSYPDVSLFSILIQGFMPDVSSSKDVQKVVQQQYAALLQNPATAPKFSHLNLEEHLPRIFTFWCFVLGIESGQHPYKGSAFEPHVKLDLSNADFDVWMQYLFEAIDAYFKGPLAEDWKKRAEQMGILFRYKLGLIEN